MELRPLRIERLRVRDFRNLVRQEIAPGPRFNVVHGDNGAGKSSLLEAIHYLAALKSFRGAKTESLIRLESQDAVVEAEVAGDAAKRTFRAALSRGRARQLRLDGKRPRSIATWHGAIQAVLFHPGDLPLAGGGADGRRALMDRMLEQIEATYGPALSRYQKALRSRNRLLREGKADGPSLAVYNALLAREGAAVGQARARLVEDLGPRTSRAFLEVAGADVPLAVRYAPRVAPTEEALEEALARSADRDRARGFTGEGPHADDLSLEVRDVNARHHASQGQQRAIVLALKVAELHVLSERVGRVPLLLLDDVSSELDRTRNRRLFETLAQLGSQVFLTTTHPEFILLDEDRTDFRVEGGQVVRVGG